MLHVLRGVPTCKYKIVSSEKKKSLLNRKEEKNRRADKMIDCSSFMNQYVVIIKDSLIETYET